MARQKQTVENHSPLVPQTIDTSRAGTMVRLKGVRGALKVCEEVLTDAGKEWVMLFKTNEGFRHVRPESVIWPVVKKPKKKGI